MISGKRFKGEACKKHPELQGTRYIKQGKCVGCNRDNVNKQIKANPERSREYVLRSTRKAKEEVFSHYGGMFCSICGFDNSDALCLDHVDGGGGKLRRDKSHPWGGYALYSWLRRNHYPEELKFRVLCFNCNAIESVKKLRKERRQMAEIGWRKEGCANG